MNKRPTATLSKPSDGSCWLLFVASLATWPLLYLPVICGFGVGLGAVALMMLWWPVIVLGNVVLLCIAAFKLRRAQKTGYIGALLAAVHSGIFVAISLMSVAKMLLAR